MKTTLVLDHHLVFNESEMALFTAPAPSCGLKSLDTGYRR